MPSTTELGLDAYNSNGINQTDGTSYESFTKKLPMSESKSSDSKSSSIVDPSSSEIVSIDPSEDIVNGEDSMSITENTNALVTVKFDNDGEDLDVLVKMERMNKEMETNNRSAQSILLSTNSVTSTTSNNNNNNSPTSQTLSRRTSLLSCDMVSMNDEEISWELWNQIITDWPLWSKKRPQQLKDFIRKGIPVYLRPLAWQYLCGADLTDSKEKFREYLKKQSACEKIIRRDIDRTYPDNEFFRTVSGQESLFNMMKAYSIHDPEVGYCQGSAFICGLLLLQSIPEEEAFSIFVQIMQVYELREIYKPNMYHLGLCMFQLDTLLQETIPELHSHFVAHAFHTSMYSSGWFLTLFTTSLPLPLVCRIFDIFLNEGIEVVFRIGIAILDMHKEYLMLLDMEGMLKYFQKELPIKHENDHESILNRAFAVKYNPKKMKKLEKDFSILKKEEQEEQVEMRRLRAENKLLKQRIDNLEKESANLAERLIKGQVINAQNAESIYVLKNDNQKLKDKLIEAGLEKERALELTRKQMTESKEISEEIMTLHATIGQMTEENTRLRDTPDHLKLEEELISVKMREAEAQLAIKELQKTIHVLNLEYQEFLNNRSAVVSSISSPQMSGGGTGNLELCVIEEELLKVKMREAETQSEMKSINLKIMQLDTEKQVAYNQIKRKDEEFRTLSAEILQLKTTALDTSKNLMEFRRQLDDKEAFIKEQSMTHKLQEMEDIHVIAELKQRVASLEVQCQELVTTGQLKDNEKHMYNVYNGIGASTDKLGEINDDMKYLLMSSNASLQSDFITSNLKLNFCTDSTPALNTDTKPTPPSALDSNSNSNSNSNSHSPKKTLTDTSDNVTNGSVSDLSASLNSIPKNCSTTHDKTKTLLNRSRSEESTHDKYHGLNKGAKSSSHTNNNSSNRNSPINEIHSNSSDNDDGGSELNKSLPAKIILT